MTKITIKVPEHNKELNHDAQKVDDFLMLLAKCVSQIGTDKHLDLFYECDVFLKSNPFDSALDVIWLLNKTLEASQKNKEKKNAESDAEKFSQLYQEVKREISSKGGEGKSRKYEPLKIYIRELISLRERWPSRRNASISIRDDVLKKSKELDIYLSEHQAQKTIDDWLKEMGWQKGMHGLPANIELHQADIEAKQAGNL